MPGSAFLYGPLLFVPNEHDIPPDPVISGLTFDLCPEFELEVSYRRRALATPASGGFVQRKTMWPEGDLRTFTLNWRAANRSEVAHISYLWSAAKGSIKVMNWTPPDGAATVVRFKGPALRLAPRTANAWDVQLELEEVR